MGLKMSSAFLTAFGILFGCFLHEGYGAPTTVLPPGLGSLEAANQSNPEPCIVAGVKYTHGQQVPREDQCEFCLCLDGELFCWWQDCSPSSSGPCKDTKSYTACAAIAANSSGPVSRSLGDGQDDTTTSPIAVTTSLSSPSSAVVPSRVTPGGTGNNQTVPEQQDVTTTPTPAGTADDVTPTPAEPASSTSTNTCYVMGTEYKLGEVLPRDTGTCLECVCDSEARVTCSPKDCASQHDDFRSSNSLDMFDVDTF